MKREPPKVTGLSPKEGPPGCKVTIRGENLGINAKDLIGVSICGVNCLLSSDWISPSKVICRTGPVKGKGDVILTTKSGGVGTCTVTFTGYFVSTGPLQGSAIWVDESTTVDGRLAAVHRTSSPTFLEDDNPLGLADDGSGYTIVIVFSEGSTNLVSEDFDAVRFLLETHQTSSFEDLKAGCQYLKRTSAQRSEGPLAFMKANVSAFMDCQQSLTAMHDKFLKDDVEGENSICESLENTLEKCNHKAGKLFEDVLNRKDKADSTRNALNVLNRFKFLFNLPINMERNIQKGDYEIVVTDYERAKSLFADTEVEVFKKVYKEVESRIDGLRKQLLEELMILPSTLDQQKDLIRCLTSLVSSGDPAWDCLLNQHKWLMGLLSQCKEDNLQLEKEDGDKNWEGITKQGRVKTSHHSSFDSDKFNPPHKVTFLEDLVEIVEEDLPDFWKLGSAYCKGELYTTGGKKDRSVDAKKENLFKKKLTEICRQFAYLVRAAFLPQTLVKLPHDERKKFGVWKEDNKQDSGSAWLPHCVRIVRSLYSLLASLELPAVSLEYIQNLTLAMRSHCMMSLFQQAIQDIKALHHRELWCIQLEENSGITTLLFKDVAVQKQASRLSAEMLKSFATCLDELTFKTDVEADHHMDSVGYIESVSTDNLPSMEERLVIVLGNCNYVANQVIPRLKEHFVRHGYPDMKRVEKSVQLAYSELDDKLFEAYTEQKSDPVVGLLEQGMYAGYLDWKTLDRPVGVRSYVKEAICNLISIHAEVYAISPAFISRMMTKVVESLAEEVCRLISCAEGFNNAGAIQARLELLALKDSLLSYGNAASNSSFKEAFNFIPSVNSARDKKYLEEELNTFKSNMRLQLMCFNSDAFDSV
uniref:Exocyst complex component 2 n=1 Tax=Saccoglossus kowalevskii TaxID=10224 RepID=A0ABM0LVW6_SACKO|nr:PREDICTED: exocyst complex component 2-like [Saccoglossus kowalevskii]